MELIATYPKVATLLQQVAPSALTPRCPKNLLSAPGPDAHSPPEGISGEMLLAQILKFHRARTNIFHWHIIAILCELGGPIGPAPRLIFTAKREREANWHCQHSKHGEVVRAGQTAMLVPLACQISWFLTLRRIDGRRHFLQLAMFLQLTASLCSQTLYKDITFKCKKNGTVRAHMMLMAHLLDRIAS